MSILRRPQPAASRTQAIHTLLFSASALGLSVLAAGVLAACGGYDDPRIADAIATEASSPLASLFGVTFDDDPAATIEAAEEAIVLCMASAGFEYRAAPVGRTVSSAVFSRPTRDEVAANGYGIASSVEQMLASVGGADPNDAYMRSLPDEQMHAYQAALTGITDSEIVFDDAGQPLDAATGEPATPEHFRLAGADGCAAQAYAELRNHASVQLLASEVWFDAQQRIQSDKEMQDLVAKWSRCMAAAGHRAATQAEVIAKFDRRAAAIVNQATADAEPNAYPTSTVAPEVNVTITAEVAAAIDALRAEEVAAALVDFGCSQDLFDRVPGITHRVEGDYIRDHAPQLVALLDAQQASS